MIQFEELDSTKNCEGLIPAIIQDDTTLAVLMLGYMDKEALEKTQKEGRVTFYSRSRGRLWTKGETSGNYLDVVSIARDCDSDSLLIRVNPHGPVCHTGTVSCFADEAVRQAVAAGEKETRTEGFIRELEQVIRQRHRDMPEGSYTSRLFSRGVPKIAQKVGEEAVETVIEAVAQNRDAMIYEASDLVYHLLVLLEATGCSISDLEKELERRHR
ncbi:MAG: bifunctional phosphoribosyl-AMP cyclohydrolase/phosphoribosyl-ATP diphosphatase HisIE [Bacteroidetes bacterium]|uniref:Histidine biosynthesis bifunctional protein HisIE n=1 Tax=Candidatus Cryptobacteroides intestinavium TaxID=2840766 RepID=A0A9D9ESF4_9BACT|nr:bifunctional phosphoribosyl-AMP cyclohydrolase/phosphoribosyl-ATP diphosphatase HisIE [Candidatus Cryptobacteroides intestinavium]